MTDYDDGYARGKRGAKAYTNGRHKQTASAEFRKGYTDGLHEWVAKKQRERCWSRGYDENGQPNDGGRMNVR